MAIDLDGKNGKIAANLYKCDKTIIICTKKHKKKTIKGYYNGPMVRKIKCRTLENNDKRRQTKSRFGNLKIRRNFIF